MLHQDNDGTFAVADFGEARSHGENSSRAVLGHTATPTPRTARRTGSASSPPAGTPVTTEANMHALSLLYANSRDPQIRESLILYHQKLVHYVATRFQGGGEALEDLIQVGNIGLINALDRYDPSRDVKFSTYAMPTIVGEIKRHFRDKTWHVKVPRWLQEMALNAKKAQQTLSGRLGRSPTIREIAAEIGASEDDALEALEINHIASAISLDTRLDPHGGTESATLMDVIGRIDSAMHDIEAYSDLRRALSLLESREQEVVHLRFFEELSQAKIARKLNISQMHVLRLQHRALLRLREVLSEEKLPRPRTPRRTSGGA